MVPDIVIFLVGAFVTLVWGSMIGALLYAASNPYKSSNPESSVELNKIHPESGNKTWKASNE